MLPDKLLSMIDMIIPNHSELFEIVPDAADINEAVDRLLDSGIGTVIVTLGADGSYIKSWEFGCDAGSLPGTLSPSTVPVPATPLSAPWSPT